MDRRNFLKTTAAIPAAGALGALSGLARAQQAPWANGTRWRSFEVTTRVEVAKPKGVARVWLPLPLAADTDWFKTLNNGWSGNASTARVIPHSKYDTALLYAEWPVGTEQPAIEVVSRFATRDRAIDWANPGKPEPVEKAVLARYLEPNEHIPTDGIVRDTALKITKGARGDVEKARAIYEWIVDNTFRDPKTRGCGVGDIKAMLEIRQPRRQMRRSERPVRRPRPLRRHPGARRLRHTRRSFPMGLQEPGSRQQQHHAGAALPRRVLQRRARMGSGRPGGRAQSRAGGTSRQPPVGDDKVKLARAKLFGAWEMNWLAYNYAQEVVLPSARGAKVAFLMYPQCETASGRKDSLDPDSFRYQITAREITA